jgi:glycerol-3-phosphate O-acyltransferase
MDILNRVAQYEREGLLSPEEAGVIGEFLTSQQHESTGHTDSEENTQMLSAYLDQIVEQIQAPFSFPPFHERVTEPYDYYRFGIEFVRPLVDWKNSRIGGEEQLPKMVEVLEAGENVILFGNHQSELDPQVLSVFLEEKYPSLAESMIFVAGNRVVSDPVAIPFSLGRNLLCIHSKRYINVPPERRAEKQRHNQRTMQLMSQMLAEGGKCIYVAPSGGRDRPGPDGNVVLSPFDAASLQMFQLMARKSGTTTHFFPLALATYSLLPAPGTIRAAIGERRIARHGPLKLHFGKEIDFSKDPGLSLSDKKARRQARADYVFAAVNEQYQQL